MPTYRNDGNAVEIVTDIYGARKPIEPGQTVQTYEVLALANFTKTSDLPYWNPITAVTAKSSNGPGDDQERNLDADTVWVKVWKVSQAEVSIYLQDKANLPAIAVLQPGDKTVFKVAGRASKLVLAYSAAGACEIVESKEKPE